MTTVNASSHHAVLEFVTVGPEPGTVIATLALNRPEVANAFSVQMMEEIVQHLDMVRSHPNCRALVISGRGKHFSAGADLSWMQAAAKLSYDDNIQDSSRLVGMFEAVANLTIPKIALVRGSTYGGAVGLVAACDFAIAHEGAKFCLSEAKLGLVPAVIAPYLCRKISMGQLRRHALTGRVFGAHEAREMGLVELVGGNDFDEIAETELNGVLSCGPLAQQAINQLFNALRSDGFSQSSLTVETIARARTGTEGQAGLKAYFDRKTAPWVTMMPDEG